jgi:hypothetical protein
MRRASIVSSPVVVPPQYVGTCTGGALSAPASALHDVVRSWDYYGGLNWDQGAFMTVLHPSVGSYFWTPLDNLLSSNPTKQIIVVLGATPNHFVTRAATGSSYRGTKGNMVPDDLSGWAAFVRQVVARARDTHGRTGLIWQLWNEIDQIASFNDSLALLGPYSRITAQAVLAEDPTAMVLAPTISAGTPAAAPVAATWARLDDGAGGRAADWVDGVCMHYYNQDANQISQNENPINYAQLLSNFRGAMAEVGVRKPVYITETGVLAADTNGGRAYQRRMLTFAALGCQLCLGYKWDNSLYPIAPYESQWNHVAGLLRAGATISSCVLGMAHMDIVIDGQSYRF